MLDFAVSLVDKDGPSVSVPVGGVQAMLEEIDAYASGSKDVVLQVVRGDGPYREWPCRLQLVAAGGGRLVVLQKTILPVMVRDVDESGVSIPQDVRDVLVQEDPESVLIVRFGGDECVVLVETVDGHRSVLMSAPSQPAVYLDPGCVYPRTPLTVFYEDDCGEMRMDENYWLDMMRGVNDTLCDIEEEASETMRKYRGKLGKLYDVLDELQELGEEANKSFIGYSNVASDFLEPLHLDRGVLGTEEKTSW